MKKLSQIVLMTIAFGLLVLGADSAMAQGRGGEYRRDRNEAQREYRQDVRRARREYRDDIRDARRDYYRDSYRSHRYYRMRPRGLSYGYYNRRPYVGNRNRYVYRNGRIYRRW